MKKGFTLIELLAVIIILAVIALIATPIVLNVVNNARDSARKSSVAGFADATKLAITEYQFKEQGSVPTVDNTFISTITYQGDRVVCGQDGENPGVYYSTSYGIVLHGCKIGDNDTLYYFGSGKVYTDKNDETYSKIFDAVSGNEDVGLVGTEIGALVLEKFPNLALGTTEAKGCATNNNNYTYMGGCYLKGAQTSNYLWYSGFLYRIMGINKDGSIRLITEESVTSTSYNIENNTNFTGSYAEKWLNEYFLSNLKGTDIIVDGIFCQGAASTTTTLQRTNCTGGIEITKKVGLISMDEMNMSGNTTSYLANSQFFLTMTPTSSSNIFGVEYQGTIRDFDVISAHGLRAVININDKSLITNGNGLLTDVWNEEKMPYILNENKNKKVTGSLNEKSSSGEYVKLANKVYRVVEKNSDGTTKLLLDSYYQETGRNYKMKYGSDNVFTKENRNTSDATLQGVGYKLNNDVLNWLVPASDTVNRNKIKLDSKWYQNQYKFGDSYLNSIKENATPITAPVGLMSIGEMLLGQSYTILTKNGTVVSDYNNADSYWILSSSAISTNAWYISVHSIAATNSVVGNLALRPAIIINSNINIIKGNGTPNNPYEI